MAIMTTSGRRALAAAVKGSKLYMAWGRGSSDWDNERPREERGAEALTAEVGRRLIRQVQYCRPDPNGEIATSGQTWAPSPNPTAHLHLRADFDFADGLGETIRELGVFINSRPKPGLPAGQTYFKPEEINHPGTLLALDHITAISRGVGSRIHFDFVLTF